MYCKDSFMLKKNKNTKSEPSDILIYKKNLCSTKVLRVFKHGVVGNLCAQNQNPTIQVSFWFLRIILIQNKE